MDWERYDGYEKAMLEAGNKPEAIYIHGDYSEHSEDIRALTDILSPTHPEHPTAIVMVSSQDIRMVLKACWNNQMHVPDDIDIATIDALRVPHTNQEDLDVCSIVKKPMFIIEQQREKIAKKKHCAADQANRGKSG